MLAHSCSILLLFARRFGFRCVLYCILCNLNLLFPCLGFVEFLVLPLFLFVRTRAPLLLDPTYDGAACLVPIQVLVDLLGEDLACILAVLVPRAGCLRLDDNAGGDVLELNR